MRFLSKFLSKRKQKTRRTNVLAGLVFVISGPTWTSLSFIVFHRTFDIVDV